MIHELPSFNEDESFLKNNKKKSNNGAYSVFFILL